MSGCGLPRAGDKNPGRISAAIDVLRKQTGLTILLGEQNVNFALRHAERIYLFERGRIAWQGPPVRFVEEAGERYL
jgi:branched-chain amino acid transport system ATP-binding protein